MGVRTRVVLYATDEDAAEQAAAGAFARIAQLDQMMSDYRRTSDLNRVSDLAGEGRCEVPAELGRLLRVAARVSETSDGAFDVTVGPAVLLWREARRSGALPDRDTIERTRAQIDYRRIETSGDGTRVRLTMPGMRLDLGGIAKGYAAQQAVEILGHAGFSRVMVGLAGDIVVGDPPPGEAGWRIGVVGERSQDAPPARTLLLRNCAVSTSGDAEQFVEIGGTRYSHIVDPATGLGMTTIRQVTVIAARGEEADALGTAACIMGPDRTGDLLRAWPGSGAMFLEAGAWRVVDPAGAVRVAKAR
jgi:thiamine biosynthesis lipoprotein